MQEGIALAALAVVPTVDDDDGYLIACDGETAHLFQIDALRAARYENQNVFFFQLAPPEIKGSILSRGLPLIGVVHAEQPANFFPY